MQMRKKKKKKKIGSLNPGDGLGDPPRVIVRPARAGVSCADFSFPEPFGPPRCLWEGKMKMKMKKKKTYILSTTESRERENGETRPNSRLITTIIKYKTLWVTELGGRGVKGGTAGPLGTSPPNAGREPNVQTVGARGSAGAQGVAKGLKTTKTHRRVSFYKRGNSIHINICTKK